MTFDPVRICRILDDEDVDYVVIGGLAATMRGSSSLTEDIDVVPDRSDENLECLERALRRLNAKIRTGDLPVAAPLDATFLRGSTVMLNLTTDFGDLDLAFRPAGPLADFAAWRADATPMEIADGLVILVASLDDLIDSKRAANRPKDVAALPLLESLREQIGD